MIETRVLRQFIAVAEALNFHRAAEQLHMSQPPLSVAIRQLEEKIGAMLFIRDRGGVTLTAAGDAFLQTAREVIYALKEGVQHARHVADGVAGKLTLSSVSLAAYPVLMSALRLFRQRYPKVELVIREMPTAMQVKAVERGEVDLAFIRKPPTIGQDMLLRPFITENVLAVVLADHPLSTQSSIEVKALSEEDFVFTPAVLGEGYHQQLIALCEQAGFYPRITQEAAQLSTLTSLVACGFGVALVPESAKVLTHHEPVRFLTIRPVSPLSELTLYTLHRQATPPGSGSQQLSNFLIILNDVTGTAP